MDKNPLIHAGWPHNSCYPLCCFTGIGFLSQNLLRHKLKAEKTVRCTLAFCLTKKPIETQIKHRGNGEVYQPYYINHHHVTEGRADSFKQTTSRLAFHQVRINLNCFDNYKQIIFRDGIHLWHDIRPVVMFSSIREAVFKKSGRVLGCAACRGCQ